jgi:isoleucyl-tRNA synthetase
MPFQPIDPKPDFPKLEEEILKFWEENKVFEKSLDQTKSGSPYTFYDGPPFATGLPHYGHILVSTVKDLFPRYQTMKGRFVRRRWGWDTHGLPIEELVERKLGISGKKDIERIGIAKFNETCRSVVLEFVSEWRKTVRRIARWVDFDHSYKTMDRDFMESVWWGFKQTYDKGLIYEGRRVLLYCPRCETPISNFEVAMDNSYKDVTEESATVKFKVKGQDNTYILAWTTTPWTLPGNVALAVGKDLDYVVFKYEDSEDQYIASLDYFKKGGNGPVKLLVKSFKGSDLIGWEYEPLYSVDEVAASDKSFKVYAADFVTTEDGTGVVHTAVVYGEDDYALGLKEGLPVVPLLDEKGIFNEKAPRFIQGQYFKQAEKLVKKDLEARGLMFERKGYTHSYPHCWRCSTALYYNAIPAWFMNIQKIKDGLLKTNEQEVNWHPGHLKHGRYQKSVEAAPDWNISRNRYWGNPIPVWKCDDKNCGGVRVVGSIKELGLSKNVFYFSRHGEAEHNVKKIASSYPETWVNNLTTKGVERARGLAQMIANGGGVDVIISSDLTRTKQTAETVGQILNVPVEFDERLREYNFGVYNGRPSAEFDTEFTSENRWTHKPEGGENNAEVQARMVSFIKETNSKYNGKKILVVSHGDCLHLLMKYFGSELEYPKYATKIELDVSIVDLHRPYIDEVVLPCEKCGGNSHRISEIFDSWVEAGSMPFAEYHYPFDQKEVFENRFPSQFVVEYIAQTRAWFYVMHVIGYNIFGKAPFENVLTTGTILAEDGSKMSKSKNNYPDPWKVIELYGVDALRFYLMSSPVMSADNLNFSERELGVTFRKNILILWNVFNYFVTYANEAGWDTGPQPLDYKPKLAMDQWAVAKTQELVNEVTDQLDSYDTVRATRNMESYINELSTWYLRRSRGRKDSEFFDVLRHCLLMTARTMAPVTPYMSEIVFKNLTRRDIPSVHLTVWPEKKELTSEEKEVLIQMEAVKDLVEKGHSLRKAANIKLRQPLALFTYSGKSALASEFEEILADELNVKAVKFGETQGFDLEITPELKQEGLARELERAIQDRRKTSGLKVGELAELSYDTEDEELIKALSLVNLEKTYLREMREVRGIGGEVIEIEGKKIRLSLE